MTTELVDDGKVCVATIDDGKANALSFDVIAQLRAVLATAVEQHQTLVIAGRDGYFCAGFDLTVMTGGDWNRSVRCWRPVAICCARW